MRVQIAAAVLAAASSAVGPAAAAETLQEKDCILSAAGLLPTIPGLVITDATARATEAADALVVQIQIEALGREATYEYLCTYDAVDGALVEGGKVVR